MLDTNHDLIKLSKHIDRERLDKEWGALFVSTKGAPAMQASHIKVHSHAADARNGNQDMDCTKGGATERYIWPWMRMVYQSECWLRQVPQ